MGARTLGILSNLSIHVSCLHVPRKRTWMDRMDRIRARTLGILSVLRSFYDWGVRGDELHRWTG